MGIGIWSMHYLGMAALKLPIPVAYDWPTVLISLLAAIAAAAVALLTVSQKAMGWRASVAGSLLMGGGIAGTHYIGMDAMRLAAMCVFSPSLVLLSLIVAVVISFIALWLTFAVRDQTANWSWRKARNALTMGLAIPVMHYVGMSAVSFVAAPVMGSRDHIIGVSELGMMGIGIVALLLLSTVAITAFLDRRIRSQIQTAGALLASIVESSEDAIVATGVDGTIVTWNRGAGILFGYSGGEAVGKNIDLLIAPEQGDKAHEALKDIRNCGGIKPFDTVRRTKGGRRIAVSVSVSPVLGGSGEITGASATFRDISNRLQAARDLRVSEERFRGVFECAPFGIAVIGRDGHLWQANAAFREITGYSEQDMRGSERENLVHPDDLAAAAARYESLWNGVVPFIDGEVRYVHRDGGLIWARERISLIRDNLNRPKCAVVHMEDITARWEAESRLKVSTDRLVLATRAGGVGIWDYDPVKNMLVWDDEMFRLYGTKPEHFTRSYDAWLRSVHPEDRQSAAAEFQEVLDGKRSLDSEFRVIWPDGSIHTLRGLAVVERDAAGRATRVTGTSLDITDQKQAALKLEESNEKLTAAMVEARAAAQEAARANAAKSRFLANMSHEIRTPMNGVIGMLQLLSLSHLSGDQRRYADIARRSGLTLLALINDILDLSKIEAGKIVLENRPFHVREAVEEVVQLFRNEANAKGLEISAAISADVPSILSGDSHRVRQVLTNLSRTPSNSPNEAQ